MFCCDGAKQQRLYLKGKAHKPKSRASSDLESVVAFNKALEQASKAQMVLNVVLQALLSIGAQHKPHLQSSETASQRNLPILQQVDTMSAMKDVYTAQIKF